MEKLFILCFFACISIFSVHLQAERYLNFYSGLQTKRIANIDYWIGDKENPFIEYEEDILCVKGGLEIGIDRDNDWVLELNGEMPVATMYAVSGIHYKYYPECYC